MRLKLFASVFILSLAMLINLSPPVNADAVDLSTSPLPISLSVAPGTTASTEIRIKNNSRGTETLKISLMKFSAYGDSGKPALKDREPGDDYFDWVSFTPAVLTAPSGRWQSTRMTIRLPKDAGFGYYYAVVFT